MLMKAFAVSLVALIALATSGLAKAEPLEIEIIPPPTIDRGDVDRVWEYLKTEVGAPDDFPLPPFVLDWKMPSRAKMGFVAPTKEYPDERLRIGITPGVMVLDAYGMVLWGIGHELGHYVLLMRDNNYDLGLPYFFVGPPDHCDPEFKTLTRGVANVIWGIYHDETERSKMYAEVERACRDAPNDQ
jgi:hypothetical protein